MIELWKDIKGFERQYAVSNLGRIKSYAKQNGVCWQPERILIGGDSQGYTHVVLSNNKNKKPYSVHRLVANAFIPNHENKPCVNHIDSDRSNNKVSNLEWCTYSENSKHGYEYGSQQPKTHYGSKLNRGHLIEHDIIEIRIKHKAGIKTIELASEYNVSQRNIQHIVSTKENNTKGWRQVI